jgi:hypothetical protein
MNENKFSLPIQNIPSAIAYFSFHFKRTMKIVIEYNKPPLKKKFKLDMSSLSLLEIIIYVGKKDNRRNWFYVFFPFLPLTEVTCVKLTNNIWDFKPAWRSLEETRLWLGLYEADTAYVNCINNCFPVGVFFYISNRV